MIAPDIYRQRFLLEGYYEVKADKKIIEKYFSGITRELKLRAYGKPIIFSPGGEGKKENHGYDAFVPLVDSGISAYFWTNAKFCSIVIYSCKKFGEKKAGNFTKKFFKIRNAYTKSF